MRHLAPDKKKHLVAGFLITFITGIFLAPLWGLITACIVGALKEVIWDGLLKKGTSEFLDFVATCIGGVFAFVLF